MGNKSLANRFTIIPVGCLIALIFLLLPASAASWVNIPGTPDTGFHSNFYNQYTYLHINGVNKITVDYHLDYNNNISIIDIFPTDNILWRVVAGDGLQQGSFAVPPNTTRIELRIDSESEYDSYEGGYYINTKFTFLRAFSSGGVDPVEPEIDNFDWWVWFYSMISKILSTGVFALFFGFLVIVAILYFVLYRMNFMVFPDNKEGKRHKKYRYDQKKDPALNNCKKFGNCLDVKKRRGL